MLDAYNPEIARERIKEALIIAGDFAKKVNINVNVRGGGWQAQSEAARTAISKALVSFTKSDKLKTDLLNYSKTMIVSDTRRTEPQKPYRSAARSKRQKSKR